jgi:hypothetical protein
LMEVVSQVCISCSLTSSSFFIHLTAIAGYFCPSDHHFLVTEYVNPLVHRITTKTGSCAAACATDQQAWMAVCMNADEEGYKRKKTSSWDWDERKRFILQMMSLQFLKAESRHFCAKEKDGNLLSPPSCYARSPDALRRRSWIWGPCHLRCSPAASFPNCHNCWCWCYSCPSSLDLLAPHQQPHDCIMIWASVTLTMRPLSTVYISCTHVSVLPITCHSLVEYSP